MAVALSFGASTSWAQSLEGRWDATLKNGGNTIPFRLDISGEGVDITLAGALETSRRKIEYQVGKISKKTAAQILVRDEQATNDARSLSGLVYPEKHLQERLYSIVPFIAKFGPGLVDELYKAVRIDCPDHQFVVV